MSINIFLNRLLSGIQDSILRAQLVKPGDFYKKIRKISVYASDSASLKKKIGKFNTLVDEINRDGEKLDLLLYAKYMLQKTQPEGGVLNTSTASDPFAVLDILLGATNEWLRLKQLPKSSQIIKLNQEIKKTAESMRKKTERKGGLEELRKTIRSERKWVRDKY